MDMGEWLAILAGGFLGSAHCVGMCGGFVALVGATPRPLGQALWRQFVYALGRVFTYMFLGAIGGHAGWLLARIDGAIVSVQQVFSIMAGVFMILIGAAALGVVHLRWRWLSRLSTAVAPVFKHFLDGSRRGSVFLAGVANGFLPCGLVYAFLALAIASGSAGKGSLMMAAFGFGTIPAMMLVGCGSTLLSQRLRLHIYRLAACLVILAGGISIRRAIPGNQNCCEGPAITAELHDRPVNTTAPGS